MYCTATINQSISLARVLWILVLLIAGYILFIKLGMFGDARQGSRSLYGFLKPDSDHLLAPNTMAGLGVFLSICVTAIYWSFGYLAALLS